MAAAPVIFFGLYFFFQGLAFLVKVSHRHAGSFRRFMFHRSYVILDDVHFFLRVFED